MTLVNCTMNEILKFKMYDISLKKKYFCLRVFWDICQASDRVWHDSLLFKLKSFSPSPLILSFYIFFLKNTVALSMYQNRNLMSRPILADFPQGSDLSPMIYNVYTPDKPRTNKTLLGHLCWWYESVGVNWWCTRSYRTNLNLFKVYCHLGIKYENKN